MNFHKKVIKKYKLALATMPFLITIVVIKLIMHLYNWEFLELSSLFTAIISANIFIIGFLMSSILSDYKESERLPNELANSLENIFDDSFYVYKEKNNSAGLEISKQIHVVTEKFKFWIKKEYRTKEMMNELEKINSNLHLLESSITANYIVRLKNELSNAKRIIGRIDTIRDTSFNEGAYAITEILSFLLIVGLIFVNYNPYHEAVFFVGFVSFVLVYMNLFIRDIDNPFGDYNFTEQISFKQIEDLANRTKAKLAEEVE